METIQNFIKQVQKKEINIVEHTHKVLKEIKKINKEYNYFINITEDLALNSAEKVKKNQNGKLSGLFISVKDDICVKDIECTCGSEILKTYKPPFNATVIEKIIKEGAIIIGKTSQDEFGFGSFSTNTKTMPKNPFDKSRSCGGSSGGSAGITQKISFPHLSLAESTGGSIANPASFCGVTGLTPTYGLVSRYGLIDYASSLDKIGAMSKNPEDAFYLLDIIKGFDPRDQTSLNKELNKPKNKLKIAIIKESLNINKEIKDLILSKVKNYDLISLPNVEKYSIPTYYIIALSEASTNLAKYTGLRYGQTEPLNKEYNEFFTEVRSKYFSKESKRRIILGTFARMAGYREAFYLKAMKTRTLIINEYKKAFQKYDILISPTMPILPPKFTEINKLTPLENYMMDILTVGPNLAGLPHISLNSGFINKLPIGLMAISDHLNENNLLEFTKTI
ncbi:Asp-tRNA(Asn)/Glu-tRNA(Gln) amidotransferase subunit GatA [Candidatus Woesearchaeota archaeon]|nr:Asp-tRNA(Asn)/Glu-tRNA(Gln) amidotransferase subunit GatA [Candidatus Woesearchaeota archaeon]